LNRGYAVVTDAVGNNVITHAADVRPGQAIRARLADGSLLAEVRHLETKGKQ
jgi:exonuclease VII large subunit